MSHQSRMVAYPHRPRPLVSTDGRRAGFTEATRFAFRRAPPPAARGRPLQARPAGAARPHGGRRRGFQPRQPEGSSPSFVGVGFVDAYAATANNVVFGISKSAGCRTTSPSSRPRAPLTGTAPEPGVAYQTITGKIAAIGWDITGGQKYWYISLAGQPGQVYVGTVASVGPALVLTQPGDPVTIRILNIGAQESTETMQSFTDARVPLHAPGS